MKILCEQKRSKHGLNDVKKPFVVGADHGRGGASFGGARRGEPPLAIPGDERATVRLVDLPRRRKVGRVDAVVRFRPLAATSRPSHASARTTTRSRPPAVT